MLFTAERDGFSHWSRQLLYFTAQSNIWIGAITVVLLFTANEKLYILKYIFTVCIVMTGVVFTFLLSPFASDYGFHTWKFSSVLTHALSPLLAIADFFLDEYHFVPKRKHVWLCMIPPVLYFSISFVLEYFYVDFGKGLPFPYYFMNFRSPLGLFGFSGTLPYVMGTFYWFILFPALLLLIAVIIQRFKEKRAKKSRTDNPSGFLFCFIFRFMPYK
ncbi:MAG: hypothetical protein E7368_02005 [Clostridiales bacterium]|nr:hypothetical protein [Clostridiales bacterium]